MNEEIKVEKKEKKILKENNDMALIGFVLSFFISIAGLVLSIIGFIKAKEYKNGRKGLALAGIIISGVSMVTAIIIVACNPFNTITSNDDNKLCITFMVDNKVYGKKCGTRGSKIPSILPPEKEGYSSYWGVSSSDDANKYDFDEGIKYSTTVYVQYASLLELIDFSNMSKTDIENWCNEKKLKCDFSTEYSDTVAAGGFISQSIPAGQKVDSGKSITIKYSLGKKPTVSQENALKKANSYLKHSAFSYTGLIEQLEYEKYSHEDAVYAVDNCGADWFEQAKKKGESYLKHSAFSRDGLIDQLEYEGFTYEQAVYGAEQNGL